MGLWSRLNGRVGRRPEPRDVTEPPATAPSADRAQDLLDTLRTLKDLEGAVESAERSVREVERSYTEGFKLDRGRHEGQYRERLEKEETRHKKVMAEHLRKHHWLEALTALEQHSDERRIAHAMPVEEEEDLKVALRSRILGTLFEGGRLAEASTFLSDRSRQAYESAAEIRANMQARNRLRQGQMDTLTGKARARD